MVNSNEIFSGKTFSAGGQEFDLRLQIEAHVVTDMGIRSVHPELPAATTQSHTSTYAKS